MIELEFTAKAIGTNINGLSFIRDINITSTEMKDKKICLVGHCDCNKGDCIEKFYLSDQYEFICYFITNIDTKYKYLPTDGIADD